jgi:arylsulfatase A-like enzyme
VCVRGRLYAQCTGLQNTVIWPQDAWALPLNETFIAKILQTAGYRTAYFGKRQLPFIPCTF